MRSRYGGLARRKHSASTSSRARLHCIADGRSTPLSGLFRQPLRRLLPLPGWLEFQTPGQILEQAGATAGRVLGERRSREEFIAQYGEENGVYLFEQFNGFRSHYSQLTYISPGIEGEDVFRDQSRAEARKEGWGFDEVQGSLSLLQRLVNGEWDAADFLILPPGSTIRATLGESIVDIA